MAQGVADVDFGNRVQWRLDIYCVLWPMPATDLTTSHAASAESGKWCLSPSIARATCRTGYAFAVQGDFGIVIIPLLYHSIVFSGAMGFEYDPNKSAENKRKRGIDFEEAQELWADSGLVEIPARTADEPRWLLVGKIDQEHWSAVVTRRGENIRLISVRRSRDEEVTIYESQDI